MPGMSVWARKKVRGIVSPMTTNTRQLTTERKMPLPAASLAASKSFSPRLLDSRALTPTLVPTATAIIRFCMGKARLTALSASWLILATK